MAFLFKWLLDLFALPRNDMMCASAFIAGDGAYFSNLKGNLTKMEKAAAALLKAGLGGSTKEERRENVASTFWNVDAVCCGVVTCVANAVCTGEFFSRVEFYQCDAAQVEGVCCLLASSGCPPKVHLIMPVLLYGGGFKNNSLEQAVASKLACAMLRRGAKSGSVVVTMYGFDLGSFLRLQAALQKETLQAQQLFLLQTKAALKRLPGEVVKLIMAQTVPVVTWGKTNQFTVS
jgi:hypothetical protein